MEYFLRKANFNRQLQEEVCANAVCKLEHAEDCALSV